MAHGIAVARLTAFMPFVRPAPSAPSSDNATRPLGSFTGARAGAASTKGAAGLAGSAHFHVLDDGTGLKNLAQLIELRWIAVFGQIATIAVATLGLGVALPLRHMAALLAALAAFNIVSHLRWRTQREVTNGELFVALLVDVGMLTGQLYLSGGATNPFAFLYLLQVTLGAVLLRAWSTWTILGVTTVCLAGLALWADPLLLPHTAEGSLADPYVDGLLICFLLNAALLVVFISRIGRNLRERESRLASLRQRAAEEEHIVRMGLLASGAAHELGTPLSTLAVILGDWRRMEPFRSNPDLLQEVGEMQAQVQRCKKIVSGILLSTGGPRGESSAQTTVRRFLDDVVAQWQQARPSSALEYDNRFTPDLPMVADSALQQMVGNVLDNALEASPAWLRLEARREEENLVLAVVDAGPGFAAKMLAEFGKPYQSGKSQPGRGLGLFLVVNVARTLGGSVHARNRPPGKTVRSGAAADVGMNVDDAERFPATAPGGAVVTVTLPLASIVLDRPLKEEAPHHGR
jgi:two-component system sensor histidine kinase RegB